MATRRPGGVVNANAVVPPSLAARPHRTQSGNKNGKPVDGRRSTSNETSDVTTPTEEKSHGVGDMHNHQHAASTATGHPEANGKIVSRNSSCADETEIVAKVDASALAASQQLLQQFLTQTHPLAEPWKFWYLNKDISTDWLECLLEIAEVKTLEDFWRLFHQMSKPSQLEAGRECYLFRTNIQPQWEDPKNVGGGRWTVPTTGADVNKHWEMLTSALVGEQFEEHLRKDICGIVMHKRRPNVYKFSLWTSDADNPNSARLIGLTVKSLLSCPDGLMTYERHKTVDGPSSRPNKSGKLLTL